MLSNYIIWICNAVYTLYWPPLNIKLIACYETGFQKWASSWDFPGDTVKGSYTVSQKEKKTRRTLLFTAYTNGLMKKGGLEYLHIVYKIIASVELEAAHLDVERMRFIEGITFYAIPNQPSLPLNHSIIWLYFTKARITECQGEGELIWDKNEQLSFYWNACIFTTFCNRFE